MDKDEIANLYNEAMSKYGEPLQLTVAMEELAELTKELSKYIRGKQNQNEIAEEMADVEIMLEQLKEHFRNKSQIDIIKEQKQERLKRRLARAK